MTVLLEADPATAETLAFGIGGQVTTVEAAHEVPRRLEQDSGELLVVIGPGVEQGLALGLAEDLRLNRPHVGVILLRHRVDVVIMGHALRAGVREVVAPDDLTALGAACARSMEISRRQVGAAGAASDLAPEGRVITVFSAKGGCGKTTIATNLAATLAAGGQSRVCLVDLDLAFGDVAIALQLVPARTMTDSTAMVGTMDEQGVQSLVTPHSPGLDTVLAPTEPGQAERIDVKVVGELMRVLRRMYDYVVIDTPPAFSEHVLAAFDASDCYVLLATLDIPALKNLRLTLEMLELLGYPQANWLVALNRSDSKVGLGIDEVERTLRVPIAAQIPSSRAVPASINRGVPLVLDEPGHVVSQAVKQLASVVTERVGMPSRLAGAVPDAHRKGRTLSLLRRGGGR
ncbi:MAG: CpaE family protein [Actinomycetales bacterium]